MVIRNANMIEPSEEQRVRLRVRVRVPSARRTEYEEESFGSGSRNCFREEFSGDES